MSEQSYLVTARKYRPLLFREVVAQEHVTETLKNAIRLDRLAHAYMFTGPRGVGKTTAARVLAKAINCTTPLDEREDGAEPCRTCDSCRSFEEGRNLNIIEIDAASNNKVDDARDLRETVRIPPQGGRMKVYIVDEVHMLTSQAFNALLKTLEEPPPYVLFIFATTEPHKVLPTIQSRCQRFDFRRIAVPETISRLKAICDEEQITADDSSLMLIARKGDGALRDALSVFDQAVSLCGTNLVYDDIVKALGVVDADLFFEVTDATSAGDTSRMIRIVEQIVRAGYGLQEFLDGLAEHLRNPLVIKTVGDRTLIEATSKMQDRFAAEAARFSESVLLRLVHIVGETADTLRNTRQPRLRLEMALLKMCSLPSALDLRSALEKLDRLEELARKLPEPASTDAPAGREKSPGPAPASAAPAGADNAAPVAPGQTSSSNAPRGERSSDEKRPDKAEPATKPRASDGPEQPEPATEEPDRPAPRESPSRESSQGTPVSAGPSDPASRRSSESATTAAPPDSGVKAPRLPFDEPALKRSAPRSESRDAATAGNSPETDVLEVAIAESDQEAEANMIASWNRLVEEIMEGQVRLGSLLRHTKLLSVRGETAVVGVPDAFHERMLRSERHRLAQNLGERTDANIKDVLFEVSASVAELMTGPNDDSEDARTLLKKKCEESPAVQSLVERFGGEIVW